MASRAAKELAQTRATQRSEANQAYSRRHPVQAAEERGLRKAQAQLQKRWGHKREATPETLEKASGTGQGPLARLFMAGSLSVDQLAWSEEIRMMIERITAGARVGTMSLETRVDQSKRIGGAFFERLGAVRAEVAYTRWRASLAKPGAVLAMIQDECGCREAERKFGMRSGSAKRLLIAALDAWPEFQREACDEIDDATLAAAQAGLL